MNSINNEQKTTSTVLKPELAFEWIKYKKDISKESLGSKISALNNTKVEKTSEQLVVDEVQEVPFSRETFKNDPVKERIYLWYSSIKDKQEMSMDEFSKTIQMPDLIETEEFLFRHPPLRYGYIWRGKVLKFDLETKERLRKELE